MKKMTLLLMAFCLIGLFLLTMPRVAQSEEKISGVVTSIHISPGGFRMSPWIIVGFADGRTKNFFCCDTLDHGIRINEYNIIYYEGSRITKVEQMPTW